MEMLPVLILPPSGPQPLSPPHLHSNPAFLHSVYLFVISLLRVHLYYLLKWQAEGEGGREEKGGSGPKETVFLYSSESQWQPPPAHTQTDTQAQLPSMTNVPRHSYVTRKLAK